MSVEQRRERGWWMFSLAGGPSELCPWYIWFINSHWNMHVSLYFLFTLSRFSSYFWVLCGVSNLSIISRVGNMYMYYLLSLIYCRKFAPHPRSLSPDHDHQYLLPGISIWYLISSYFTLFTVHPSLPYFIHTPVVSPLLSPIRSIQSVSKKLNSWWPSLLQMNLGTNLFDGALFRRIALMWVW